MKVVVVSDSHGNLANIKHVMGFAEKINAGAIVHCGDWDNPEAIETVLSYKIPLYSVLGNADINPKIAEGLKLKAKGFNGDFLEIDLGGKKVGVIHNITHLVSNIRPLNILFFGHWQKQKDIVWKGIRAVNPGELEHKTSFAVYDTISNNVEFIHEQKR